MTLERNLCISQDGELPTGQELAANSVEAPGQETHTPCSPTNDSSKAEGEGEQGHLALYVCPSQQVELEVEKGWEEVETEKGDEEQEPGLLCEEAEEAELACSMQYDEEELEQLNMMVYRVGDEMSTLLSPPSQGQSPAHNPNKGEAGGSSGASSTEASPRRLLASQGRRGIYVEEEDRVFFMDDLDAAGDGVASITREASSCGSFPAKAPESAHHGLRKSGPRPHPVGNGWYAECPSEQPCQNTRCPNVKRPPCASAPGSEPLPYTNGWEMGLEGTATESAEVVAHRMGGMKLSATVIFNPRSPSLTELAVDKLLLPRPAASQIEPCGPLVATHCLLNSCVCCGSCEENHEDSAAAETNGPRLGLALGLERHCMTAAPSSVIQSSACRLPPRGPEPHGEGDLAALDPPAEPPEEEPNTRLCQKCLVAAPGPRHRPQGCSSSAVAPCSHQLREEKKEQDAGGRQRDRELDKDKAEPKDSKKETKEDGRRSSRCAVGTHPIIYIHACVYCFIEFYLNHSSSFSM